MLIVIYLIDCSLNQRMNETESLMRFFIAGIMQGSLIPAKLHAQNYRSQIKQLLLSTFDNADVYDPLANHNQSIDYDDDMGKDTFFNLSLIHI